MSTVDARDITKPVNEDFVTQTTAELRALKVLVAAIETALQNEDLDIRADVAALLTMKLGSPLANLALPALVANGALIVNGAGTGLVWDADYGEFVANAAALTAAVEDATAAAAAAQAAAEAAQEAVDTGAVSKSSLTEQIMNGHLIVERDGGGVVVRRDDDITKMVQLRAAAGTDAMLEYGAGYQRIQIPGDLAVTGNVAIGGTASADDPVAATDLATKLYVDRRCSTRYWDESTLTVGSWVTGTYKALGFAATAVADLGDGNSADPGLVRLVASYAGFVRLRLSIAAFTAAGTAPTTLRVRMQVDGTNTTPVYSFPLTAGTLTTKNGLEFCWPVAATDLVTIAVECAGVDVTTSMTIYVSGVTFELLPTA